MKSKSSVMIDEATIRATLIGLLEDFQEHAEVVLEAKRDIEADAAAGERFDQAVARLDAALTSLEVTVPAILRKLDQLDEIPEDDETD